MSKYNWFSTAIKEFYSQLCFRSCSWSAFHSFRLLSSKCFVCCCFSINISLYPQFVSISPKNFVSVSHHSHIHSSTPREALALIHFYFHIHSPPPQWSQVAGTPYYFRYKVEGQEGNFTHSETFDGNEATGTYSLTRPAAHTSFTYLAGWTSLQNLNLPISL